MRFIVSPKFFQNIFDKLLIMVAFSTAFYSFSYITADPDLWGHIRFGKELFEAKSFLYSDIFSYTAYGHEWVNHEWLSELFMFCIFNVFGSIGLLIMKMLVGLAIVYILFIISRYREKSSLVWAMVSMIAVMIMGPGFMIRPQLVTLLFTALFFFVFHLYLERDTNRLWLLPLIMIIWVNSHGGFIIGAGLLPVVVICVLGENVFKGNYENRIKNVIVWSILTEISILVNPYGVRILTFLFESLSVPRDITEWNPITVLDFSFLKFKILSLLVLLFVFLNRGKNRYWEIGIILVAMVFSFKHQRHSPIFALLAVPFLTENLSIFAKKIRLNERIYSYSSYTILILVLGLLIGYQLLTTTIRYTRSEFNIIVDPSVYPVYAIQFLKENEITGNILVPFMWGEYVIWKLYPECKVSIDGRFRTVYPEEIINDHFTALRSERKWMELVNKYPPDIILSKRNMISKKMINANPDWIYVYSDDISIIFIKDEKYRQWIKDKKRGEKLIYPKRSLSIYFP